MILWSGLLSPFSAKVRIYMKERGLEFEQKDIPWNREKLWGPKPDEFLAASPRGEVPALVDGDLAVFDSTMIWEYLEDAYPDNRLAPTLPNEKAQCRMWEDKADHVMANHITTLIREGFMKPDGSGDQAALGESVSALNDLYTDLNTRLQGSDYLCDCYSIADITTFMCLTFAQTLGAPLPSELTSLNAWHARLAARPVVAAELQEILAGAAEV